MINNLVVSSITIVLLLTSTCGQKKKEEASSVAIADPVKQDTTKNAPPETTVVPAKQSAGPEKTSGLVSHKFMNKGCPTVILVAEPAGDTLVLIPRDALIQDYDVDGLQISFNYRLLKMRSMPGCDKGVPAEITSVSKR